MVARRPSHFPQNVEGTTLHSSPSRRFAERRNLRGAIGSTAPPWAGGKNETGAVQATDQRGTQPAKPNLFWLNGSGSQISIGGGYVAAGPSNVAGTGRARYLTSRNLIVSLRIGSLPGGFFECD